MEHEVFDFDGARYFVDERSGCVAVRDKKYTDPEYRGLHDDTRGVVKYWQGEPYQENGLTYWRTHAAVTERS